ncbi:MAG: hypothetical protein ACTHKT_03875 [Solirubrobacterales bacterium]
MPGILDYIGQHLLIPILATVVAGALIASARRYFRIGREVADNDARASELNEDLWRWVRDRNRQLENELRGLLNTAGNQLNAGSLENKAVAVMRQALHEYRDEATSKVREFSALARSEGRWHRQHRDRRGLGAPSLGLRGQERLYLNRWRQRPHLVNPGGPGPDLIVKDDPTADEPTIAPLESESGLTWAAAATRRSI